ncbi:MAG: AraC family transcriptional regulator [Oscillospiraceae bacterium]|jgi:AraC family transcriptional regulator|nr:AraC family transcriptional regulator [Oscillospiraceae bacterium]
MDWTTRMNLALDYIEANLEGEIDFKQAAKMAFCSQSNFSNMFLIAAGIPISEYIRRRRLSLAALELQNGEAKIIDIALKYGYSSPTAFNRAFQNQHKVPPQYARSRKVPLITYPRISLQINLKGDTEMKVRIERKPAFTTAGIKKAFRNDSTENLIPEFWTKENLDKIKALSNSEPREFFGLCADFDGAHEFDYYIAVATTAAVSGLETYEVPAATWAILEKDGDLMELAGRFWKEWLPSSGYRRADENIPDVEVYPEFGLLKPDYEYELWFPVVKL